MCFYLLKRKSHVKHTTRFRQHRLLSFTFCLVALRLWHRIRWSGVERNDLAGNGRTVAATYVAPVIVNGWGLTRTAREASIFCVEVDVVALEFHIGKRDIAADRSKAHPRAVFDSWRQEIQSEVLIILANDDVLRAFCYDPVSKFSIGRPRLSQF